MFLANRSYLLFYLKEIFSKIVQRQKKMRKSMSDVKIPYDRASRTFPPSHNTKTYKITLPTPRHKQIQMTSCNEVDIKTRTVYSKSRAV